jgi:hypothetical protein
LIWFSPDYSGPRLFQDFAPDPCGLSFNDEFPGVESGPVDTNEVLGVMPKFMRNGVLKVQKIIASCDVLPRLEKSGTENDSLRFEA